jgi:hypothetical protein
MPLRRAANSTLCCGAITLAALLAQFGAAAADNAIEYEVEATYLYKFAPFVDWPAAAYQSATSPVNLCVVGDDPVASVVGKAAAGQSVGPRPLVVRHLALAEPDAGCQIMYIAGSDAQSVAQALAVMKSAPVLTVTDEAAHPADRAIISFVVADNHVRFDIDDAAAADAGIVISSKLLGLAHSVKLRGTGARKG